MGSFFEAISEKLGTVTGAGGLQIEVNETCITTYPVLYDSLYVVGGNADRQGKFDMDVQDFVNTAYKFFKPIGLASTGGQKYRPTYGNLAGGSFRRQTAATSPGISLKRWAASDFGNGC